MDKSAIDQFVANHPHWTDFILGVAIAVSATAFVGLAVWLVRLIGQSASLRIGANWTWEGTSADPSYMKMHPNVNIVSRLNARKQIVHSIWVREFKSRRRPGKIYGKIDLVNAVPEERRTTGGDPLNLVGPTITCRNLTTEVEKAMRYPVWVQMSDDRWYKAQSAGNPPGLAERIRGWIKR